MEKQILELLTKMDARFEKMEEKIDKLTERVELFEKQTIGAFKEANNRLDLQHEKLN
ncbi:hypothetical protein [Fictibacillus gelatini]|uniref:hypothetical protein n=1 Tax=Fictibacillus gelatini TaxID=225985 RepID=UPI0003FD09FD|nr:hypothetical protein [Fictibacillus gelatini]